MSHAKRYVLIVDVQCSDDFDEVVGTDLEEVRKYTLHPGHSAEYVRAVLYSTPIPTLREKLKAGIRRLAASL